MAFLVFGPLDISEWSLGSFLSDQRPMENKADFLNCLFVHYLQEVPGPQMKYRPAVF